MNLYPNPSLFSPFKSAPVLDADDYTVYFPTNGPQGSIDGRTATFSNPVVPDLTTVNPLPTAQTIEIVKTERQMTEPPIIAPEQVPPSNLDNDIAPEEAKDIAIPMATMTITTEKPKKIKSDKVDEKVEKVEVVEVKPPITKIEVEVKPSVKAPKAEVAPKVDAPKAEVAPKVETKNKPIKSEPEPTADSSERTPIDLTKLTPRKPLDKKMESAVKPENIAIVKAEVKPPKPEPEVKEVKNDITTVMLIAKLFNITLDNKKTTTEGTIKEYIAQNSKIWNMDDFYIIIIDSVINTMIMEDRGLLYYFSIPDDIIKKWSVDVDNNKVKIMNYFKDKKLTYPLVRRCSFSKDKLTAVWYYDKSKLMAWDVINNNTAYLIRTIYDNNENISMIITMAKDNNYVIQYMGDTPVSNYTNDIKDDKYNGFGSLNADQGEIRKKIINSTGSLEIKYNVNGKISQLSLNTINNREVTVL